jgi:hypothetical protein
MRCRLWRRGMTRCLTRCLRRGVAAADEVRAVVPRLRSTHLVKKKEAPPQLSHAQAVLGVVNLALRGFSVVNTHKPEPKSTRRMDTHACSEHVVIEGYVQAGKCFKEGITESRVFQRAYLDKFLAFLRNTQDTRMLYNPQALRFVAFIRRAGLFSHSHAQCAHKRINKYFLNKH